MKRTVLLLSVIFLLLCSCAKNGPAYIVSVGEVPQTAEPILPPESGLPIGSLRLISLTETVEVSQTASVTVKGLPNTEYDITVTYSSESEAAGLENKVSDNDGTVSWSWRVGARTKPGRYTIDIRCHSEKITLYFEVLPKE